MPKQVLPAARVYAKTAAAVPHAYHMPSHIFTRLGYWDEAATTNENAWQISNDDVKAAGEPGELRDFHSLNYLSYNYLQLGRYKDAKKAVDLFAAQYAAITNRKTAPDSQDLQARHVRGRTIFALPDRVLYGYFDTLARFIVESESWSDVPSLPLIAPSSDFVVMKLHLEAMAAAKRKDAATAKAKAAEMMERARVPGQHPFVQQILTMQAREAAAVAAHAAGDAAGAVTEMEAAVTIEDAIDSLSQPPYPIIPAHELYGSMLMEMGRPAEARKHFEETLRRTPGRPKAIAGIARAAEAMGDTATAKAQYTRLIEMWKNADHDRPELQAARRFLQFAEPVGDCFCYSDGRCAIDSSAVARRSRSPWRRRNVGATDARRRGSRAVRARTALAPDRGRRVASDHPQRPAARRGVADRSAAGRSRRETICFSFEAIMRCPRTSSTPWTLTIDGEVARPVTFRLEEIRRMRAERRSATIECAGNGRGGLELPTTSGVQWGLGAVSNATWTGVPLAALLERAGVQASALHFWMEAADRSPLPAAPKFLRSIPRETALGEAFVAYEMNGQPLPLLHGGPLRLVVPRWYGMASTKWLTHVHARATESDNHFMARGYRYADGSPVDLMRVKSLITAPLDGDQVDVAATRVTGVAWTGTGTVAQVEISSDGGRTWQQARFTSERAARHVAPVGSRRRQSGRPASSACARARPTRPGTRSPSTPLRTRPAMETTRSTRCASMRAEAPTWIRRVAARA